MKTATVELNDRTLVRVAYDGTQGGWDRALQRAGIARSNIYRVDPS